jgi:hypothetical protein
MKKSIFLIACAAICATITFTGCKSSKNISSSIGAVEIPSNVCETMAEMKPATRTAGKGTHFSEMTARNIAEMQARGQFARAIATKIKTATGEESFGYNLYSGDTQSGNSVQDQGQKTNDSALSIAEGVVANTVVIKSAKFKLPNQQFEYWVCLEYQAGVAEMATEIARKVEQKIPDEQKLKMNFEFEQFRKKMEDELEKMNK